MNTKTPISALQELMAARRLPLPVYVEEGFGMSFKCTVVAAGITAVGISSSKKNAKHESAKNALIKLGVVTTPQKIIILTQPSPPENKAFKNYVGELNEYSSKHTLKYPDYNFVTVSANGQFYFKCVFLGKEVLGTGMNKKDAKQDSAKKMLELLGSTDLSSVNDIYKVAQTSTSTNLSLEEKEKIFSLYKNLTLQDPYASLIKADYIQEVPEINIVQHDSLDVLKAKLQEYGINYRFIELQSFPFVICVKIKGTDLHFIQSDNNREEATRKVLQDVLEAAKSGCSLDTNDMMSFS